MHQRELATRGTTLSKDQLEDEEKSDLFRRLLLEEIDIILKENREELVKRVHKKLRAMAEVPE